MVARLVSAALRNRSVVLLLALALIAAGLYSARTAALDVFPEFAPPIVEIQTEAPGFAAEDVEALVTTPIEAAIAAVPNLVSLRSSSAPGLAVITATFPYGTDPNAARQFVSERLSLATESLPSGVRPAVSPLSSALTTILAIGLRGDASLSAMALHDVAQWTLRPRLLAVPGVANVVIYGGAVRQLQVTTTPERLHAARMSLDDLVASVEAAQGAAGSGFIDLSGQRLSTWLDGRLHNATELSQAPAAIRDGRALALADVADVRDGGAVPVGGATVNGEPGVVLLVSKQPGVNVPEVTEAVEAALAAVAPVLPAGVHVEPSMFRSASFIEHALGNLERALLAGALLVVIVLFLFLGHARAAMVTVIAIPLSLLAALAVLRAAGATLNVMILGGLAIAVGEVVDDAIIDVENVWRRLRAAPPGADPTEVVLAGCVEVRSAVVYATLIVALVFLPVIFLGGMEGALFRPLAVAYVLATSASLLVALTVTPVLANWLLPATAARHAAPPALITWLRRRYQQALTRLMAHPRTVFVASAGLVALGIALLPLLRLEFLPAFHETNFVMHMSGAPGVGIDESARVGAAVARAVMAVPGVQSVTQQIGRSTLSEDAWGAERSELLVHLEAGVDAEEVTEQIRERSHATSGFAFDLKQFLNERIEELMEGTGAALVVKLRGSDLAAIEEGARLVGERVARVPGVVDVHAAGALSAPGIHIRPRRDDLLRLGVSMTAVERALRSALGGLPVGRVTEDQRQADIVVRLASDTALDPERLGGLPIAADAHRLVPLSTVADVELAPLRVAIAHEDGVRTVVVRMDVEGRATESVAGEVSQVTRDLKLPPGVYAEVGGEYEAAKKARQRLLGLGALALVGIFVLLVIDFGSSRLAGLTMVNVPLAFVGAVGAVLLAAQARLSLGSIVGFVTVFGITIRNGIVLVAHFRREEAARGASLPVPELVEAAADRLAPILMTALVTGIALLPLLLLGGHAGGEIEQPMALVIVGGLITSTWLNLFVTPMWYRRFAATGSDRK